MNTVAAIEQTSNDQASKQSKPRAKRRRRYQPGRKHNPEILRFRRIARALDIPWKEVVAEKNRLADLEQEQRQASDEARHCAWFAHCKLNGWADTHIPFWRAGFQRAYGKRFAKGADYTIVPQYDQIADSVRSQVPEFSAWETEDIFEHLLSEYNQQTPVITHYSNALADLAHESLRIETPF